MYHGPEWRPRPLTESTWYNNTVDSLDLDGKSHLRVGNVTAPALTSCGTSPSIVGTDIAGTVTLGTAGPTGCTITFNSAYANTPICSVTWEATPLASQSYAVTASKITLTQTATSSDVVDFVCHAQNAG